RQTQREASSRPERRAAATHAASAGGRRGIHGQRLADEAGRARRLRLTRGEEQSRSRTRIGLRTRDDRRAYRVGAARVRVAWHRADAADERGRAAASRGAYAAQALRAVALDVD